MRFPFLFGAPVETGDAGYWMLVVPVLLVGRSLLVVILDTGFWILDSGFWMLVVPLLL
ncbi:MAG: hypothetical protein QGF00_00110 [Planctomycetota bacterium]|jgi:hypothetical protein|nr:hypothetical protein [Planctomycetota bacterium]|tara:strand:- start:1023 stop:1196 length:174 start_codon:yes stop_codon:yes gene_type:complete